MVVVPLLQLLGVIFATPRLVESRADRQALEFKVQKCFWTYYDTTYSRASDLHGPKVTHVQSVVTWQSWGRSTILMSELPSHATRRCSSLLYRDWRRLMILMHWSELQWVGDNREWYIVSVVVDVSWEVHEIGKTCVSGKMYCQCDPALHNCSSNYSPTRPQWIRA